MTDQDRDRTEQATPVTVLLRPISSPLPLGFLALFMGSLLLSASQLRWIPVTQSRTVAIGILAIVVPLQLAGCVFGFLARDPACGTGMGVLAGTWAATGVATLLARPGSAQPGLGIVLVTAAAALLLPALVGGAGKVAVALAMGGAAARFAISGGYELTASPAWRHSAGVAGVVVAALAAYAATAFELEGALGRLVLPVGRSGRGRRAVSGRFADQTADLAHEPGVREQL